MPTKAKGIPLKGTNAVGDTRISGAQACVKWVIEQRAVLTISEKSVVIQHPVAGRHESTIFYSEGVFTAIEIVVNQAYTFIRDRKVTAMTPKSAGPTKNKSIGLPGSTPIVYGQ